MSLSASNSSSDKTVGGVNNPSVMITADWDGPDDPKNPKNFALWRKWAMVFAVSFSSLCV
jgi:hypothetical protein